MKYYPISLNIKNRDCLVAGGGSVGLRKASGLLECGARVSVVSPESDKKIRELAAKKIITLKQREYRESDLDGVFLVMGATDDQNLNRAIHADAVKRNILCNIADRPEICDFILPALVKRGDMTIAISTSGKSPAFAKYLRKDMEKKFGDEYARFLELMGAIRKKLLKEDHEPEAHKHFFNRLISCGLLEMIKEERTASINRLLKETLGNGYEYKSLILRG